MKESLKFIDEKSSKFWNIEVKENTHTVHFGKTGAAGQKKTKKFSSKEEALKDAEKLYASKLKKGYNPTDSSSPVVVRKNATQDRNQSIQVIKKSENEPLETLKAAIKLHFKPWLLTKDCEAILDFLMSRLKSCEVKDNELSLIFFGDGYDGKGADVPALFGKPGSATAENSISSLINMHGNSIILGDQKGYGESVYFPAGGYDPYDEDEETLERFEDFCDAGQNWFVLDYDNENSLGEPIICLWDHGASLEYSTPYIGQEENSYGTGGFLLRVLAYMISPDNKNYENFSYG